MNRSFSKPIIVTSDDFETFVMPNVGNVTGKFYRYMSMEEFHLMESGEEIVGHHFPEKHTSSDGVFFIGENTPVEGRNWSPVLCGTFLPVDIYHGVLVEFEAHVALRESWGIYTDLYSDDIVEIPEFSLPSYSRYTMVPLRYSCDFTCWNNTAVWHDFN